MSSNYRLLLVILATAALGVGKLQAQPDDEDEEEFGSFGLFANTPRQMNVALKLTQGPKVQFGNLGTVSFPFDHSNGAVTGRIYMDGEVQTDFLRPYSAGDNREKNQNGNGDGDRLYPNTSRYQTYSISGETKTLVGDYLSYQQGLTRNWSYVNPSQESLTKPGYMAFNIYSTQTQGTSLEASRGYTGGVELSVSRDITNPNKRVRLSLTAGITLSGINNSKNSQVTSTLHTYTDYYLYYPYVGTAAPVLTGTNAVAGYTYVGPSYDDLLVPGVITETTTTISQNPDDHADDPNGDEEVEVSGRWKMKGAYFTFKVGPQITAMITPSLGLSASVGVAGTYANTTYSATESFSVLGAGAPKSVELESNISKFLPGYYANVDATWEINERSGLFAGVSYENLGEYNQGLNGRTSKIDLSATAGVRGGLNFKF